MNIATDHVNRNLKSLNFVNLNSYSCILKLDKVTNNNGSTGRYKNIAEIDKMKFVRRADFLWNTL